MKRLITRDDVLVEHRNGSKEILIDRHTVITAWAREAAESFGIRFVTEFTKDEREKGRFIIAANWKMNFTREEAMDLVARLKTVAHNPSREMVLCVPHVYINEVKSMLVGTEIKVGAQNMFYEEQGAFTGEISPKMLKSLGVDYVILGHSERRQYFKETDDIINKKLKKALDYDLIPIFCVGETLDERRRYAHFNIVRQQITRGLDGIPKQKAQRVVIAYEPVWAIGTGLTAKPEDAQQMHSFIRKIISQIFDKNVSLSIKILYGGSVKAANIDSLMSEPDIDGALVGGASLKFEEFSRIYNFRVM